MRKLKVAKRTISLWLTLILAFVMSFEVMAFREEVLFATETDGIQLLSDGPFETMELSEMLSEYEFVPETGDDGISLYSLDMEEEEASAGRLLVGLNGSVNVQGAVAATEIMGEGFVVLQYETAEDADLAFSYFENCDAVDYVEYDTYISVADDVESGITATEREYNSWGYGIFSTGEGGNYGINLDKFLNAYSETFTTEDITVAVLDTGIETTNAMFENRIGLCNNFSSDSSYVDGHSHGTHCAGTIVEATPSNVKIQVGKILSDTGRGTTSAEVSAIYWAVDNGADVISMSLGRSGEILESENEALAYANDANVIVVVAAGNNSQNASEFSPACGNYTITVGATGDYSFYSNYQLNKADIAYYSNWGDTLDIVAPGTQIYSAAPNTSLLKKKSGTSMATPHVSAVCALLKCFDGTMNYERALSILQKSGEMNGYSAEDRILTYEGWTYSSGTRVNNYGTFTVPRLILGATTLGGQLDLTFDGNGASNGGAMSPVSKLVLEAGENLPSNAFVRAGYTFIGWNTKADGTGIDYAEQTDLLRLVSGYENEITLYAQWQINSYGITYVLNGGTNHSANPISYQVETNTIILLAPTRKGFNFSGWYTNSALTAAITQISKGSTGDFTLYAKWTPIKYTITFNGNGASSGSMAALANCLYDSSYTLTSNRYTKRGYTFTGWNTKADGSGTGYKNGQTINNLTSVDGTVITLYARWKANQYSIVFDGNKATSGSMAKQSCKYGTTYNLKANGFKRKGYTFVGWNTKKDGSGKNYKNKAEIKNLSSSSGGVVTLYAKWRPNTYTIEFRGNSGKGSMTSITCKYNKSYKLPANQFTGSKKFVGWNTKKDGTGKSYKNRAEIKNLTATNGKTIVLYAQWK